MFVLEVRDIMKQFIYTNIGFEPNQHKILKYLAVERHLSVSRLIREAIERYLRQPAISPRHWKEDYFFRMGTVSSRGSRKPKQANSQDQIVYGL